jgi:hypothetical protein
MKLVRVARNVILASFAWRYIARRRALARQRRSRRRLIAPVLFAGSAGALWAARRRIAAGARRMLEVATPAIERAGGTAVHGEPAPGLPKPERVEPPMRGDGKAAARPASATAGPTGYGEPPGPSPKKRRRRARRQRAEEREKAERESAHGAKVKVEVNATPDLRAPLGDLKH